MTTDGLCSYPRTKSLTKKVEVLVIIIINNNKTTTKITTTTYSTALLELRGVNIKSISSYSKFQQFYSEYSV